MPLLLVLPSLGGDPAVPPSVPRRDCARLKWLIHAVLRTPHEGLENRWSRNQLEGSNPFMASRRLLSELSTTPGQPATG
jgi:hypothetical protein